MALKNYRWNLFAFLFAAFLCLPVPVLSQEAGTLPAVRLSPANHPAAETLFVPSLEDVPVITPDPAWYIKSGAKKGLSGRADTDAERFAAPDVAVLNRGFAAPWQALLGVEQEAAVLVMPDSVAGLSATKKVLIIPSGGLAGTARSLFFKAALAEFVRQGGVLLCMTQARGSDFSALPVPDGQRLEAVGWTEDAGPLFRASSLEDAHALTARLSGPSPALETDGYFTAVPRDARILLARRDGHPVMILYAFGKGWVVASALFTDFSFLLGPVNSDEQQVIRNLLAWVQEPGKNAPRPLASPAPAGGTFSFSKIIDKQLRVQAGIDRKGDTIRLSLEIAGESKSRGRNALVRAAGQEKSIAISGENTHLSFDLPSERSGRRVSYAVYSVDGRALARGSLAVPQPQEPKVSPDRPAYSPGDRASVRVGSMGKGEILVSGLGFADNKIISGQGSIAVPVPDDLPAGTYPLQWTFDEIHGNRKEGAFTVDISGYRTFFENISIEKGSGSRDPATAVVKIGSTGRPAGRLRIELTSPTGKTRTVAEPVISLKEGTQTIPVPFPFTPDAGGIWELSCTLLAQLPEGAGIPSEPVIMDRAGVLFDAGDTAVLSLVPDRTFFYEPSGPVQFTAALSGSGKTTVEVFLDDKRITREKIKLDGTIRYPLTLSPMDAGLHRVRLSLEGENLKSTREENLIYGLGLPDLATDIRTGDPASNAQGPFLPITVMVSNQGKSQAEASHVGLWEGDRERGGTLIAKLEVPLLLPRAQHSVTVAWPLYAKAGPHKIVAAADSDGSISEADKHNNDSSLEVTIPDLLLLRKSTSPAFRAGQPVSLPLALFNLTGRSFSAAELSANIDDANGARLATQRIKVDQVPAGIENRIDTVFKLDSALMVGDYRFAARVARDGNVASVAGTVTILPTLLLTGSLEGTPAEVPLCTPFAIHYSIQNAGNLRPSAGTARIELIAPGTAEPVLSKEVPLAFGPQTFKIDRVDLPQAEYVVRVTASAKQEEHRLTGQFTLAEQPVALSGPIHAVRLNSVFPRVLVWFGREGRVVEQAAAEKMLKHAFEQEDLYYRIVDSEEDFSRLASTGMFNVYVLFEPQEMLVRSDWLKGQVERGHGLVIIGSGDIARALAEDFGFRFEELPAKKQSSMISFSGKTALALSGTMPVTGRQFIPRKRGAATAAVYADSKDAAALIDHGTGGTSVVLPLPLSRSAFSGGPTEFYSLLVRTAALFAAPQTEVPAGPASGGLALSSPSGQFKVRIREILPPGSRVLWASAGGDVKDNVIAYTATADREPKKLLYLYQPAPSGTAHPDSEILYECRGKFMIQGKIE